MSVVLNPLHPGTAVHSAVTGRLLPSAGQHGVQLLVVRQDQLQLWVLGEDGELAAKRTYHFPERVEEALVIKGSGDGPNNSFQNDQVILFMGDNSVSLFCFDGLDNLVQRAYASLDVPPGSPQALHPARLRGVCVSQQFTIQENGQDVVLVAAAVLQGLVHVLKVNVDQSRPQMSAAVMQLPDLGKNNIAASSGKLQRPLAA